MHRGFKKLKSLDSNTFIFYNPNTTEQVLFFISSRTQKIDLLKAKSIVNIINLHYNRIGVRLRTVVIARRYEPGAYTYLATQNWSVYTARDIRQIARRYVIKAPMDNDPYDAMKWGMSPPFYTAVRVFIGIILLATAMVPTMLMGAWQNNIILTMYPLLLTLIVGGGVAYYMWYADMEFKKAVGILILYSITLNVITRYIMPLIL